MYPTGHRYEVDMLSRRGGGYVLPLYHLQNFRPRLGEVRWADEPTSTHLTTRYTMCDGCCIKHRRAPSFLIKLGFLPLQVLLRIDSKEKGSS